MFLLDEDQERSQEFKDDKYRLGVDGMQLVANNVVVFVWSQLLDIVNGNGRMKAWITGYALLRPLVTTQILEIDHKRCSWAYFRMAFCRPMWKFRIIRIFEKTDLSAGQWYMKNGITQGKECRIVKTIIPCADLENSLRETNVARGVSEKTFGFLKAKISHEWASSPSE